MFKIVLLALLLTGVYGKGVKWQVLKSLNEYPASAYTLKEGVSYFEIREYMKQNSKYNTKKHKIVFSAYTRSLDSYVSSVRTKFRRQLPSITKKTNMRKITKKLRSGAYEYVICNGFMIDSDEKIWRMNTTKDAIEMLGEIDTPAEVQAVLWLNKKYEANSYRKTSKGYEVRIKYGNTSNKCGDIVTITKKGKIVNYRSLKQKTKTKKHTVKGLGKTKILSVKEKKALKIEEFKAVATGNDGSVYVIGNSSTERLSANSSTIYKGFGCIIKFDKNNKKVWSRAISGQGRHGIDLRGMGLDRHNNLYVVGTNSAGEGVISALIIKLNKKGNIVWSKSVGGSSRDVFRDVVIDNNGNAYASGSTMSKDGDVVDCNNGGNDTWLVKFSKNGKKLWDRTNGGSEDERFESISIDNSNNIYATGEVQSVDGDITGNVFENIYSYKRPLVIKFNKNGHKVWDKIVVLTMQSRHFVDSSIKKGRIYAAGGIGDAGVIRMDKDGNVIWKKSFGSHGGYSSSIEAIDSDTNGNLYAAAGAEVIKVDKRGEIVWRDRDTFGYFYDISVAKNGHIYAVGESDGQANIVEFDKNGKRLWVRLVKDAR